MISARFEDTLDVTFGSIRLSFDQRAGGGAAPERTARGRMKGGGMEREESPWGFEGRTERNISVALSKDSAGGLMKGRCV